MADDELWLFSYGTLQHARVQRKLFGRELENVSDSISGFELATVTITDPSALDISGISRHPILRQSAGDKTIAGSTLRLSEAELAIADRYEAGSYRRIPAVLDSGRIAFVYIDRDEPLAPLRVDGVRLTDPDAALFSRLLPVARRIFASTFATRYDEDAFERFCEMTYSPDGSMAREFGSPDVRWHVAIAGDQPVGYAKLTSLRAPMQHPAAGAMELQQIYVLPAWHGTGVADRLMQWGLTTAKMLGAPELYLTVFDDNERAKRFYTRYGFEEVGRCTFRLDDSEEDDRIWRRAML